MSLAKEILEGLKTFADDLKNDRPVRVTKIVRNGRDAKIVKGKPATKTTPMEIDSVRIVKDAFDVEI